MKQEFLKLKSDTLRFTPPLTNNRPTIASSATLIICKPDGTTRLADGVSATVNGTTGELTYALTSTHTPELGENYVVTWDWVVSAVHYYETTLYDVVLHRLAILTTDDDLYDLQNDIKSKNENVNGTVGSAAAGTLVDTNQLTNYPDDYFNGGIVEAMNPSTGAVQRRVVSDFVQSTGSLSVTPNWATTPDSTYKYVVYKPFRKKIEFAWEVLMKYVRAQGLRPALIMESQELKVIHIYKTLQLVCVDFIKEPQDVWSLLADKYKELYDQELTTLRFAYDADESGAVSEAEQEKPVGRKCFLR